MTIKTIIYAVLLGALIWSFYQDQKVDKAFKKAKSEKQSLEDSLR